jgi:hypothetical protein
MSNLPLDARLLVPVPGLAELVASLLARLPPGTPMRRRGTGRTSGAPVTHTSGWLFHVSPRGRIAVHDFYWEWPDALETVGLPR